MTDNGMTMTHGKMTLTHGKTMMTYDQMMMTQMQDGSSIKGDQNDEMTQLTGVDICTRVNFSNGL